MKTVDELVAEIVANINTNKWLSGWYDITYEGKVHRVGVKAFGKWIQRLQINERYVSVGEHKTIKAFKANTYEQLISLLEWANKN